MSRINNEEFDPGSGWTLAACLTHASRTDLAFLEYLYKERALVSGGRVSNTWVINLLDWDNNGKLVLIPDKIHERHRLWMKRGLSMEAPARRQARGWLASWWGNGSPRQRSVAGLRGWTSTLGLRHGPDSYGRQQWGILRNGGNSDAATPREWRRPSGCKVLSIGKKPPR